MFNWCFYFQHPIDFFEIKCKIQFFPPDLFPDHEPISKSFGLTGMKKLNKVSLLDMFAHVPTLIQKHNRTPLNLSIAHVVHKSNLYSES